VKAYVLTAALDALRGQLNHGRLSHWALEFVIEQDNDDKTNFYLYCHILDVGIQMLLKDKEEGSCITGCPGTIKRFKFATLERISPEDIHQSCLELNPRYNLAGNNC
jgi:hypothetical protein